MLADHPHAPSLGRMAVSHIAIEQPIRRIRPYVLVACTVVVILGLLGGAAKLHLSKQETPAAASQSTSTEQQKTSVDQAPATTATPLPATTPTTTPPSSTPTAPTPKASTKPTPAPSSSPIVTVTPIPSPQNCTQGSYTAANALTISATATSNTGLKIVDDAPQYYQVYGYTASQVRNQLNSCHPAVAGSDSKYDAETNWWINFAFWTTSDGAGKCYVNQVAVGLHLSESFPKWIATPIYDATGLASSWNSYIGALQTHEDGHKALAKQYANSLYSGLKSYPHTSCTTIVSTVNTYGNNQIAALQAASDNYDTTTNHGATQGAVFP